jgi:hypothetical protein
MTLEQRVEKLERQNRWMKRVGAVAVAVVAAVALIGQAKDEELKDLRVRSLKVVDDKGTVGIELGSSPAGSVLFLADKDGKRRAVLSTVLDESPALTLFDKHGKGRAQLALRENGNPVVTLENYKEDGERTFKAELNPDFLKFHSFPFTASLSPVGGFLHKKNKDLVSLGVPTGLLILRDGSRRVRLTPDGVHEYPSLSLFDGHGRFMAVLGVAHIVDKTTGAKTTTAENTLTMYDGKLNVIWQAPEKQEEGK